MTLPRVKLFLLGGTITMNRTWGAGVVPSADARALCQAVPGLDQVAQVEARTDQTVASCNLTFQQAIALAAEITEAATKGAAEGFVIVQGTDTLGEMAFLLECLLDGPKSRILQTLMVMSGAGRDDIKKAFTD